VASALGQQQTSASNSDGTNLACAASNDVLNSVLDPLGYRQYAGDQLLMLKRREFIALIGGAAAAWPAASRAQQPAMPVIGFLHGGSLANIPGELQAAFHRGLAETGYVEGRNVAIEYRGAENQFDRFPALAADLVRRQVTVIIANAIRPALAAKAATTTIPIVFSTAGDPVQSGLVASLSRPGGNLTGVTSLNVEVGPKRLELLHEVVPAATLIGLLLNPTNPLTEAFLRDHEASARILGVQLHVLYASAERDIDAAFATLVQVRAGGLVVGPDAFLGSRSEQLTALALHHAVPTIYQFRDFVAVGGLMSYGGNLADSYRVGGVYTGRILKGEKPADLPVQQATRVELVINMKTAKALGLTFPLTLLGRADEVIE
jgi:putative tryptophan/tyrosine transport system substrate-binding protein